MKLESLRRTHSWLIVSMIVTVLSLTVLTSCDDDPYGYYINPRLVGSWQLTGVSYYDVNEFDFYSDGTGYYYAYDSYGNWSSWPITAETNGGLLTVYVSTGQVWQYQYSVSGSTLVLNDLQVAGNTLYYQYVY